MLEVFKGMVLAHAILQAVCAWHIRYDGYEIIGLIMIYWVYIKSMTAWA